MQPRQEKEVPVLKTKSEFLDSLSAGWCVIRQERLRCVQPSHQYPVSDVCLDKKCAAEGEQGELLCSQCLLERFHGKAKNRHSII